MPDKKLAIIILLVLNSLSPAYAKMHDSIQLIILTNYESNLLTYDKLIQNYSYLIESIKSNEKGTYHIVDIDYGYHTFLLSPMNLITNVYQLTFNSNDILYIIEKIGRQYLSTTVGAVNIALGVYFYENGQISRVFINPFTNSIQYINSPIGKLRVSEQLLFYNDGSLYVGGTPERAITNRYGVFEKLNDIGFYRTGEIEWIDLWGAEEIKLKNKILQVSGIGFYENGRIMNCFLENDFKYGGKTYMAYRWIGWRRNGSFFGYVKIDPQTGETIFE